MDKRSLARREIFHMLRYVNVEMARKHENDKLKFKWHVKMDVESKR